MTIDLVVPAAANLPHVLQTAAERIAGLMRHALRFLELHGSELLPARERRRMTPRRAERRQAIVLVCRALLKHVDLLSLRVGMPRGAPPLQGEQDRRYVNPPGQAELCRETGISLTRLRRALRDLRRAGYIFGPGKGSDLKQPRLEYTDGKTGETKWCACRVVYALSRKFFARLGLGRKLGQEQAKAYARAQERRTRIYAGPLMEARDAARGWKAGSRERRAHDAPGAPTPVGRGLKAPSKIQPAPTTDQAENQARVLLALKMRLRERNPEWPPERCDREARALLGVSKPPSP